MEIMPLSSSFPSDICATIGFFDGVHKGHRSLLDQLQVIAKKKQQKSAVITFRNHPRTCLHTDYLPRLLSSTEDKLELIAQLGIDYCFLLDFTPEIANHSAAAFMQNILSERLNVKTLLIGYNHRFGKDRNEGFDDYVKYGKTCGIEVNLAKEYVDALAKRQIDKSISSTLIRNHIQNKAIGEANELLGYPYSLEGKVIHGDQLGQKLGFPTANLEISDPRKMTPPEGIYATYVNLDGNTYPGMTYIGNRPTVTNGKEERIEVHIIGYSGNLYGKIIRLEFIKLLRDNRQFDSLEKLQKQLTKDREEALIALI